MSLKQRLKDSVKEAMKAQDKARVEATRLLLSAIQYEEMQKGVEDLADDAVSVVLQAELKKRREEMEFVEKAGRAEDIAKLKTEIALIEGMLPKQLTAADLEAALQEIRGSTPSANMGLAMKLLKEKFPGQYDGKLASEIAKRVFS